MFVLPIIAGTFTIMSVFLTLPLLSFLSFQSIPTIDWCSFPSITTYFGDLIDLGMNVAPKVTCCAVTSLGFFVLALLAFLGYYASRFGCGPLQLPTIVLKPSFFSVYAERKDASLGDVTLGDGKAAKAIKDHSLPEIVALKETSECYIPLHALTPRHSLMNIPVDTSDDDTLHALTQPIVSEKFLPELPLHGSMMTNLVDISDDLAYEDEEDCNPWSIEPELDAEFASQLEQLILSIAALEISPENEGVLRDMEAQCYDSTPSSSTATLAQMTVTANSKQGGAPAFLSAATDPKQSLTSSSSCQTLEALLKECELNTLVAECSSDTPKTKPTRRGGLRVKKRFAMMRAHMEEAEAIARSLAESPANEESAAYGQWASNIQHSPASHHSMKRSSNDAVGLGLACTSTPLSLDAGSRAGEPSSRRFPSSGPTMTVYDPQTPSVSSDASGNNSSSLSSPTAPLPGPSRKNRVTSASTQPLRIVHVPRRPSSSSLTSQSKNGTALGTPPASVVPGKDKMPPPRRQSGSKLSSARAPVSDITNKIVSLVSNMSNLKSPKLSSSSKIQADLNPRSKPQSKPKTPKIKTPVPPTKKTASDPSTVTNVDKAASSPSVTNMSVPCVMFTSMPEPSEPSIPNHRRSRFGP